MIFNVLEKHYSRERKQGEQKEIGKRGTKWNGIK
jgi:hypothetical protein